MLFPFFGADGNGIRDLAPSFREVAVTPGVKAKPRKTRTGKIKLSTDAWKDFPELVDGYRRISIGNNWAIFIVYVQPGSEETARKWFRDKFLERQP